MTKPVTLSNQAFAALRREKGAGESDSTLIERLIREAHQARQGPANVPWHLLERAVPADAHRDLVGQSDAKDRADPWER